MISKQNLALRDPRQWLRAFFSADLSGATQFKPKRPPLEVDDGWPETFTDFFKFIASKFYEFAQEEIGLVQMSRDILEEDILVAPTPCFWKVLGDEILFYAELHSYWQVYALTKAFHRVVSLADQRFQSLGLGVKGCAWTAGFPIRNRTIEIPDALQGNISLIDREYEMQGIRAFEEAMRINPLRGSGANYDFIGLEVDQGFRLCTQGRSGRLLCSPDLCWMLTRVPLKWPITFSCVGWKELRGIYNGNPVPIVWVDFVEKDKFSPVPRDPFEAAESTYGAAYLSSRSVLSKEQWDNQYRTYSDGLVARGVSHILPYLDPREIPPSHQANYENSSRSGKSE